MQHTIRRILLIIVAACSLLLFAQSCVSYNRACEELTMKANAAIEAEAAK